MKSSEAREKKLRMCLAEIQAGFPKIESAHTPLVAIAGLAEYLGDTLHLAQKLSVCSRSQVLIISERVKQIALSELQQAERGNQQT